MLSPLAQQSYHDHVDPHVRGRWLSDLVLGAQDGLVNTLGVVLGVAAASASARLTLAAGLAAGCAEAVSMAAVAYTSSRARGDLFRAEQAREYRHVRVTPDVERDEIRALYASKGFVEPLLSRVVDTICASPDVWVAVMMMEEHGLSAVDHRGSLRSAWVVGLASLAGAALPVVPFAFVGRSAATISALVLGAVGLFVLGFVKAKVTVGSRTGGGLVLMAIGMVSAIVGYLVGALFATS